MTNVVAIRDPGGDGLDLAGFSHWLERESYGERTQRNYLRTINNFNKWLQSHSRPPVPAATWEDVRAYSDDRLPFTYSSRTLLKASLAAYWRFLGRTDRIDWAVKSPKQPKYECRALEADEVPRLLEAAREIGTEAHVICCALYYQGLRREEAARLRWDDIRFRDGVLHGVGKGSREFNMPLHPRFAELLASLEPESSWVLPGRVPGAHINPNKVWWWVRLAGERAGIGHVTPHRLRHSAIATVHDTTELRTASTFARHANVRTTMIYTRTKMDRLRRGMESL